jgi:hypothetical protein
MEDEDYRIITINDNTIKCFRDGRVHTLFTYKDGREKWIERNSNPHSLGYIDISIGGKLYKAHRLIMIAFVGKSDQEVDHINRIKTDNRFENLRYCTRRENNLNMDRVDNAKGYYLNNNKWQSQISIKGKQKYLGRFEKEEDAHQAFLEACAKYRNEL